MNKLQLDYFFEDYNSFIFPEIFHGITYAWEALQKSEELLNQLKSQKKMEIQGNIKNVNISGFVIIGEGTTIDNNVSIEGPVVIGKNCVIKHGSLIRPGTIISNNCTLGHGCEVKNSLVFDGAKIQSLTFAGDSIIGKSARVGSGAITANRRFDQEEIGIKYINEYVSFKRDFFGCVLGDYSRLGANCTTLPGTHIGPYTWIMPLTRVGGFVDKGKLILTEQKLVVKDNIIKKLK